MGEIDDVQHAVDQRQRDRHQRVDRAGEQAVDDGGKDDLGREHRVLSQRRYRRPAQGSRGHRAARAGDEPLRRDREDRLGVGEVVGKITLMSPSCTCVLTGAAPVFWPLTNFVGP